MTRVCILLCLVLAAATPARAQNVIERLVSPGPLSEAHEGEATCNECHVSFDRGAQATLCVECHEEVGRDIEAGTGFHGRAPEVDGAACRACHSEHLGRDADILNFTAEGFDHSFTDFALTGGHAEVACADCHAADTRYAEAPLDCATCHRDDDPHEGRLTKPCESCHTTSAWDAEIRFDHATTSFDLRGGHAETDCMSCHKGQQWEGLAADCASCHREDDAHEGRFGYECESCHTETSWTEVRFDHRTTGFALVGRHAPLECAACHGADKPDPAPTTCIGCHRADDAHEGSLGTDCADCHSAASWTQTSFDHTRDTDFALLGAHASAECAACHEVSPAFTVPGMNCAECHREDDPHRGQLGDGCGSCHGVASWTGNVRFDHNFAAFPLLGAHAEAECADCHATAAYLDASTECVDCHREDDRHNGSLGPDCATCHAPVDWARVRFDHAEDTGFALTGAHEPLACASCHLRAAAGEYEASPRCISCHASEDKHRGSFGTDCSRCHNTEAFWAVEMRR